ncbi:SH3 domain-containing protein [Tropicimonas aquimaris]|uniref:SH3 domain-containing protein n=1 Tax=Tropicimonas aquimaris TaxID=914152 RepID=A0ABW3IL15_9RHOB
MKTLLVSMTAVALSTAAAQASTSATATTDLNLRAAPGPAAEVISVIPAQQPVAVNGCLEEANWCEVVLDG